MREIPLSQGKTALVDDDDYERISKFKWYYSSDGYAVRNSLASEGLGKTIMMHRTILNMESKLAVDHINMNRIDNRKSNIRFATCKQNKRNMDKRSDSSWPYKGIKCDPRKKSNPWQACIFDSGRQRHLGMFPTAEQAARAYDDAARITFGEFARLNFPDDTP